MTYYRSLNKRPDTLYLGRTKTLVDWAKIMRDKDMALTGQGLLFVPVRSVDVEYEVWKPLTDLESDMMNLIEVTGGVLPPLIRKR